MKAGTPLKRSSSPARDPQEPDAQRGQDGGTVPNADTAIGPPRRRSRDQPTERSMWPATMTRTMPTARMHVAVLTIRLLMFLG